MSVHRFFCLSVVTLTLLLFCPRAEVNAAGDPQQGEALYVGSASFERGGAPCLACHSLTGVGISAGANFGPDLSSMYENYGAEGVAGVLEALMFPGMEAIYTDRPLTEAEIADLVTYFQQTAELSATPDNGKLALQVIIGVGIMLVFTFLIGKRRMQVVRQPLVDRQRDLLNKGGLR